MRGKKAKQIRREVYGDLAHRTRSYIVADDGSRRNTGSRRLYLDVKKEYKNVRT